MGGNASSNRAADGRATVPTWHVGWLHCSPARSRKVRMTLGGKSCWRRADGMSSKIKDLSVTVLSTGSPAERASSRRDRRRASRHGLSSPQSRAALQPKRTNAFPEVVQVAARLLGDNAPSMGTSRSPKARPTNGVRNRSNAYARSGAGDRHGDGRPDPIARLISRQRDIPLREATRPKAVVPSAGVRRHLTSARLAFSGPPLRTRTEGSGKAERLASCLPEITERLA